MNKRLLPLLTGTVLLLAGWCRADDWNAGVTIPSPQSEPANSVIASSASLQLTPNSTEITWSVTTSTSGGSLRIESPRFGWLGEAESYPDQQFPELTFSSNSTPIDLKSDTTVFVGTTNVTSILQVARIDPFVVTNNPPLVIPTGSGLQTIAMLLRIKAVKKESDGYWAAWTVQRVIEANIKAGVSNVTLSYKPRPAFALRRWDDIHRVNYLSPYCLTLKDLKPLGPSNPSRLFRVYEYSIPATIDDKQQIYNLNATVDIPNTSQETHRIVAFCSAKAKAMIGSDAPIESSARTDERGIVHVLSIETIDN